MKEWIYVLLLILMGCSTQSPLVFLEYCIPISHEDPKDPPSVGVVLNYKKLSHAPASNSSNVLKFIIATESPLTVVKGNTGYDSTSLVVVDNQTSDSVSGRLVFNELKVFQTLTIQNYLPFSYTPYDGVLGGDVLRKFAVRFYQVQDPQCTFDWTPNRNWPSITFLREIPDSNESLASDGFAVFPFILAGGGNMVINGKQEVLMSSRVGVWICLNPDPFDIANPPPPKDGHFPITGIDAYALIATGTKPLVLTNELAYRLSQDSTITLEPVEKDVMNETLQGYNINGLKRIAIIGDESDALSPCAELAKRRAQEYEKHNKNNKLYPKDLKNKAAAAILIDLSHDSNDIQSLSLPSDSLYWTSLWKETQPKVPMYDIILGNEILSYLELIIDYPQKRLISRCVGYTPDDDGICLNDLPCCISNGPCNLSFPCMQLP